MVAFCASDGASRLVVSVMTGWSWPSSPECWASGIGSWFGIWAKIPSPMTAVASTHCVFDMVISSVDHRTRYCQRGNVAKTTATTVPSQSMIFMRRRTTGSAQGLSLSHATLSSRSTR